MDWFTKQTLMLPNWAWLVIALVVVAFIIFVIAWIIHLKNKGEAEEDTVDTDEEAVDSDEDVQPAEEAPAETKEKKTEKTEKSNVAEKQKAASESGETVEKNEAAEKGDAAEKKPVNKVYHISKRKEDNKWQVKAAKGARAIKLFATQAEAIDYAKALAANQEARIVIHKEDGSFRNLTYKKK